MRTLRDKWPLLRPQWHPSVAFAQLVDALLGTMEWVTVELVSPLMVNWLIFKDPRH